MPTSDAGAAADAGPAAARVHGEPATLSAALTAAAGILRGARLPLVMGLAESTVEAQRRAVEVADLVGGAVDPGGGDGSAALYALGRITATLGEIRQRAELLVFWGVDPDALHPGFSARYLRPAAGRRAPARIAVDVGTAQGPQDVEDRVTVRAEREVDALWTLRARVRGRRVDEEREDALGAPLERLQWLLDRLAASRYGVVLHDAALPAERRDPLRAPALAAFVGDTNDRFPVRLIGVRPPDNAVGAENVLAWQTGFAGPVHFGRGYPRYMPGEFDAESLLARGEADAVLVVGTLPPRPLSGAAAEQLGRTPTVLLGPRESMDGAHVTIPTAPAEQTPGSVYRLDGVALRRSGAATELPTEEQVLARLARLIRGLPGGWKG